MSSLNLQQSQICRSIGGRTVPANFQGERTYELLAYYHPLLSFPPVLTYDVTSTVRHSFSPSLPFCIDEECYVALYWNICTPAIMSLIRDQTSSTRSCPMDESVQADLKTLCRGKFQQRASDSNFDNNVDSLWFH